ncbi:MAG: SGNH/GDSL hydrolase family protein [Mucinivorans sp.]
MKKIFILTALVSIFMTSALAQSSWHNPVVEKAILHGQIMPEAQRTNFYQRLPDASKSTVTDRVWGLSQNSAGESLCFYTNSKKINVRYAIAEGASMPHMPATGKSGVDLYATDASGQSIWLAARYWVSDTSGFDYAPIYYRDSIPGKGYLYELYLPPYNTVTWINIGVDEGCHFEFVNPTNQKPIIAYGTSITQGACASRPGMIWPTIVERELKIPLINLGFSGNGLLEKGVLDLIKQTPAQVVILDCMPNLSARSVDEIKTLVINATHEIRSAQPNVPILIVDHLGYPHSGAIDGYAQQVEGAIKAQTQAIESLKKEGVKGIHYLRFDEIAMPQDGTVEGVHPSDYGMRVYADAYIKKLSKIIN